jgi:hypothetical protein
MPDAYVIEVFGRTAGIVARDSQSNSFNFFSAAPRFNAIEGQRFSDPLAARGAGACPIWEPTSLVRLSYLAPAVSGRSVSGEKSEGSERDPFVWFVCKMLLTFFTVIASTAAQTESFRPRARRAMKAWPQRRFFLSMTTRAISLL